jgi:hypothetical protein
MATYELNFIVSKGRPRIRLLRMSAKPTPSGRGAARASRQLAHLIPQVLKLSCHAKKLYANLCGGLRTAFSSHGLFCRCKLMVASRRNKPLEIPMRMVALAIMNRDATPMQTAVASPASMLKAGRLNRFANIAV